MNPENMHRMLSKMSGELCGGHGSPPGRWTSSWGEVLNRGIETFSDQNVAGDVGYPEEVVSLAGDEVDKVHGSARHRSAHPLFSWNLVPLVKRLDVIEPETHYSGDLFLL